MSVSDERPSGPKELRVLVAEDSPVVLDRLVRLLEELPWVTPIKARSASEALRYFDAVCPSIALVDANLPDLPGFEVLSRIRASGRACLVIVLTNSVEPSLREASKAAGADYFLHKVGEVDRILEIIQRHRTRAHR